MNWQQMVKDLLESGLTQTQLADKLSCSQSMVSDLASGERGSRLSWELGNPGKRQPEMSLPKRDLRIYLDADTRAAAEIITEALMGKNHKYKLQAARLVRAGLVRIGRD